MAAADSIINFQVKERRLDTAKMVPNGKERAAFPPVYGRPLEEGTWQREVEQPFRGQYYDGNVRNCAGQYCITTRHASGKHVTFDAGTTFDVNAHVSPGVFVIPLTFAAPSDVVENVGRYTFEGANGVPAAANFMMPTGVVVLPRWRVLADNKDQARNKGLLVAIDARNAVNSGNVYAVPDAIIKLMAFIAKNVAFQTRSPAKVRVHGQVFGPFAADGLPSPNFDDYASARDPAPAEGGA